MAHIFDLLEKASEKLQYPKLRYPFGDKMLVFSLAGPNSRHKGKVLITNAGKYPDNTFYGTIEKDTVARMLRIKWNNRVVMDNDTKMLIRHVVHEPTDMCKIVGRQFSYCCFCGTAIETKESLAVGYGPICAEKWGLPWGEVIDSKNL